MILSVKHKFIFVRGRKVAGTSVEIALSTLCGPGDIVSPLMGVDERRRQALSGYCGNYSDNPSLEAAYAMLVRQSPPEQLHRLRRPPERYSAHSSLSRIMAEYPGSLDCFRVLLIARCPYARVLSVLNMQQTLDAYERGGTMEGEPSAWESAFDKAVETGWLNRWNDMPLYRSPEPAMNAHVLRYETLQKDFDGFVASLGVDRAIVLPHVKKGLMSNSLDVSEFLRRDQIEIINTMFSEEFEAFGYPLQ